MEYNKKLDSFVAILSFIGTFVYSTTDMKNLCVPLCQNLGPKNENTLSYPQGDFHLEDINQPNNYSNSKKSYDRGKYKI